MSLAPVCRALGLLTALSLGGCALPGARGVQVSPRPPLEVQGKLAADALWRGIVIVADDFQVPSGRTLRIAAGTRVLVRAADTSKTEPEYLDNATELLVRGNLVVEGAAGRPVVFESYPEEADGEDGGRWGGIIFDGGGGELRHCRLSGAETGVTLLGSSPLISDVTIADVQQGVAIHGGSAPQLTRVTVNAADGGIACWPGSAPTLETVVALAGEHEGLLVAPGATPDIRDSSFGGRASDVLWGAAQPPPANLGPARVRRVVPGPAAAAQAPAPPFVPFVPLVPQPSVPDLTYRGEQFIGEDVTWAGEVLIDGTVMVSPLASLTVAPGTVVRFAFRDTDGDGVGESEIFVQGRLLAEGTAERPIVFTALDGGGPGRWGAINLMGTDAEESRLAWCLIESSFRGLHSHFSRFRVEHSFFRGNYRSIQFQESTAAIADCAVTGSASALRFRDSTASLEGLAVFDNTFGIQILRSTISLAGSVVAGNRLAGMHVRESEGTIAGSRFEANAPGLRVSDCRLSIEGNRLAGNSGGGLLLRRTEGRIEGNRIEGNLGNGVSTDSPAAVLRRNAIVGSLRFALESNAAEPIDAAGNWWGPGGASADAIFDAQDDPALGPVVTDPPLAAEP